MLRLRHSSAVSHYPSLKLLLILLFSLSIHPDKIRIATGQIAGVDKDGRVSDTVL